MARKSRTTSSTTSIKPPKRRRSAIPEPFQLVTSATIAADAEISVPMLVLYGEWLKAVGFPIGSAAIVTTEKHGELALHRLGLGVPRRFRVRAMPR